MQKQAVVVVALLVVVGIAHAQSRTCKAVDVRVTDSWCNMNCNHDPLFCPPTFCSCSSDSQDTSSSFTRCWAVSPVATDYWCKATCLSIPPDCPSDYCKCSRDNMASSMPSSSDSGMTSTSMPTSSLSPGMNDSMPSDTMKTTMPTFSASGFPKSMPNNDPSSMSTSSPSIMPIGVPSNMTLISSSSNSNTNITSKKKIF